MTTRNELSAAHRLRVGFLGGTPTPWDYMWNADTELFEGQHRAAVDGSVVWVEASEEDLAGFPALTDYKLSFLGWDHHWWY